jgi:hypothetical protein
MRAHWKDPMTGTGTPSIAGNTPRDIGTISYTLGGPAPFWPRRAIISIRPKRAISPQSNRRRAATSPFTAALDRARPAVWGRRPAGIGTELATPG